MRRRSQAQGPRSSPPAIAAVFRACRREERAAFIPYVAAGDPDLRATGRLLFALERSGADFVELGVPFSDPVADGPVNQRAAQRSLRSGTTLEGILEALRGWRRDGLALPAVLFTYYNPVLAMGLERFAERASECGADAVLAVDLPPEEAAPYRRALARRGVGAVFLASPTTSPKRLALAARASTAFLYYVSRLGVTGARRSLPPGLAGDLDRARRRAGRPVAVGFGISTPEQARAAAAHADGVVVGSALVRLFGEGPRRSAQARAAAFCARIARALRGGARLAGGGRSRR